MEGGHWKKLPVRLTLQPGRRGTKRLWREYGERLVCVRYRYDEMQGKRIKTVELLVEEVEWERRSKIEKIVSLKIRYHEQILREAVKRAGGKWDGERKVWLLPLGEVKRLGLEGRVTEGAEL
jgi:hypothetical protein